MPANEPMYGEGGRRIFAAGKEIYPPREDVPTKSYDDLIKTIVSLKDCLRFYADEYNWVEFETVGKDETIKFVRAISDGGQKARECLEGTTGFSVAK